MVRLSHEKIEKYYRRYRYQEIGFSRKNMEALGLIEREVYAQWGKVLKPVRIYAASMTGVQVELDLNEEERQSLLSSAAVTIMYSFIGLKQFMIPMSYAVHYEISGKSGMARINTDTWMLSLSCPKQPPDYIVEMFGDFLHLRSNVSKRRDERIAVNALSAAQMGLNSIFTYLTLDGRKSRCVVQDLSFSGSAVLLSSGVNKINLRGVLQLIFLKPDTLIDLSVSVARLQRVKGNTGLIIAGLKFEKESVPLDYSARINSLLENP